ncbi:WecB/TagA/CpsF family glycosyltransferase [Xylophilus sp. GOD-11R]|uniref:WecB/TagA/CpsF family glycosyltransferase n=1 Tax=Xylophilus sp. GOD-11R TaxID=3089814 RepID=UPI00298C33AE|nr:WecB/TagA/CpsF family glycosyltransferase [Xylophilus sp. GOD-11R]WPB56739.1 WecB/TagA/CpsF family glycosyltransferase [Xylophilus sp. GOD-11R]
MKDLMSDLARPRGAKILAFVNAHAMNSAVNSHQFFDALMGADILLRDGSGVATLLRMINQTPGFNLNGTDLIPHILKIYNGQRIALFGTDDQIARRARSVVLANMDGVAEVDSMHGFLELDLYIASALHTRPALIILGMGMPKQEILAIELRKAIKDWPCLIICGGAIIDFIGGKVRRAPNWMRFIGLEWLFRLVLEPRRLFNRYVIGNPVFLTRSVLMRRHIKERESKSD